MPIETIHEPVRCETCGTTTHQAVTTVTCDHCGKDIHDQYYNQYETNPVLSVKWWREVPENFEGYDVTEYLFDTWECYISWLKEKKEDLLSKDFDWLDHPMLHAQKVKEFLEVMGL